MAQLDATVVNVAVVRIGDDLDASLADLQWVSNGYLVTLASLILLGGSLGDRLGRRRVFVVGVVWFAVASALCGVALTRGSSSPPRPAGHRRGAAHPRQPGHGRGDDRAPGPRPRHRPLDRPRRDRRRRRAVRRRLARPDRELALGLPAQRPARRRHRRRRPPLRARDPGRAGRPAPRRPRAALAAVALATTTYGFVEATRLGAVGTTVVVVVGLALLAGFVVLEDRERHPMVPPSLFTDRQFTGANVMTLLTYAALGGVLFFLTLQLQTSLHYTPLEAGLATLPLTILMLLLAGRGGELAARIGPRRPMAGGPVLCAAGWRSSPASTPGRPTGWGPARCRGLRPRAVPARRTPHGDRPRRRPRPLRRHGERGQQRRRPHGQPARRRRPARGGRSRRRGLHAAGRPHRGLPDGDARLQRAADRRGGHLVDPRPRPAGGPAAASVSAWPRASTSPRPRDGRASPPSPSGSSTG